MPAVKGEESNQPVVTLYVFPVIPQPLVPNMIVAFWPDGKVIWSEDPIEGGPPYSEGRVDPQALETLLEDYKTLFLVRGLYPRTFSHKGFNPFKTSALGYNPSARKERLADQEICVPAN